MTPAELAIAAALGASALTGGTSLGVVWLREWLRGRAADRDTLIAAVNEMLSRAMSVSLRAEAMGQTMKIRSGLGEGIDVLTHQRKPYDPLEMHDWIAQDMDPLNAAWSVIWAHGDQELIRRANALLAACSDLISVSTARMPAPTTTTRIRRHVVGDRWTPQMQEELQKARVTMAHAREQLAQYARQVTGKPAARLFGHDSDTEPGKDAGADQTAITASAAPESAGEHAELPAGPAPS